jgi:predicted amidophosphoribosyltransferase
MHDVLNTAAESRQRLWQLMNSAEGLCEVCSAPITHYSTMCDACAAKKRLQVQARRGFKPWRPGGKGRPPKVRS